MKQWKLQITAYADRLLADLDLLDWPESIKTMQRNWIGRSVGATVAFPVEGHEGVDIEVFTTRPDTLFGATYMVLAPEHPLLDEIVPSEWPDANLAADVGDMPAEWKGIFGTDVLPPEAVAAYRDFAAQKSELERQAEGREKTGVFTGAFAKNPTNGWNVPIFVADYVLMGYGTGAIMAVPAHDQRDFEFAREFDLPIAGVVRPPDGWLRERGVDADTPADEWPEAYVGDGVGMNSSNDEVSLDGLPTPEAKQRIAEWLEASGTGEGAVIYKLHDWLFSRQRYWGEPFPIVYDDDGNPLALPESLLPVELPEMIDFEPRILADDDPSPPEPPLAPRRRLGERRARSRRRRRSATDARRTRCRSGPARAGTTCATSTPPTTTSSSTRPSSSTGWAPAAPAASTSTSAAPSTPCCTFSMRASGTRCCTTSVTCPRPSRSTACSTRAHSRRSSTSTTAACTSRPTTSKSVDGEFLYDGQPVHAAPGPHGQEPEEHGHARRDLPRLRRRHAASLRDVHGAARRGPGRGAPPTSPACTDSSSVSGATWSTRTPGELACVVRRGRRRDAPAVAPHDRGRARRHGNARVQHRDRAALRAEQPSHAGGGREGQRAGGSGARDGADARSAHAACRRGAVGEARAHVDDRVRAVPGARPRAPRRRRSRDPGAGERQGARPRTRARPAPTTSRHEAAARADEKVAALLDGATVRKVVVVPGRLVNFVT